MRDALHLLAWAPALAGCTVVKAGEGGASRTLVGVVQIKLPATKGKLAAVDARTLGLGWDAGPFLGWRGSSWVIAQANECQMVVIIRSGIEADQAAKVLEQLKGQQICVADFSNSLQPEAH